jgi:hypothetical protein
VGIPFGKDAPRDDKKVLLDRPLYKCLSVSPGNLGKDIKGTQRFLDLKLPLNPS